MAHFIRIILAIFIVVFAVNNVIVDAGEGTKNRKKNLITRASKHEEKLKLHEDKFKSKYDDMSESVISELSALNNIIIDHIIAHEKFNLYLKNIFEALQQYADGQIKARYESLEVVYNKWEKNKFPNKEEKENVRNILIKEGIINTDTEDKTKKKSPPKNSGSKKKKNKKN